MVHMTSRVVYRHAKNQLKPEIGFPRVKEYNESQCGMIVSGANEFMNIIRDIACPLLAADNQSIRHGLLVYPTLQFDKETTTYEFFTLHPAILCMGRCETILANIALDITPMSVLRPDVCDPQPVLLKDDETFVLSINLLSSHSHGNFLVKQNHGLPAMSPEIPLKRENESSKQSSDHQKATDIATSLREHATTIEFLFYIIHIGPIILLDAHLGPFPHLSFSCRDIAPTLWDPVLDLKERRQSPRLI
jgi:hypothetical protein